MAAREKYDKENIAMLIAKLWGGITDDQFDLLKEHLEIKTPFTAISSMRAFETDMEKNQE